MRKTTKAVVAAFMKREPLRMGNTQTNGTSLYLFGNEIAKHEGKNLFVSNAGWFSHTTKERLNGIPNVHVVQRKGKWYLNGELWDGKWTKV